MPQINDTVLPFEIVWEGRLENEEVTTRGSALPPAVKIGKAYWWPGKTLMGESWEPPTGMVHFGMVRFVFSIQGTKNQTVVEAIVRVTLMASGAPNNPIVFDMLPNTTLIERKSTRSFTLGPELKFADAAKNSAEVTLGKAETTINIQQGVPTLAADGIGTSSVAWTFAGVKEQPVIGNQSVYAILDLPPTFSAIRARVELEVLYQDSLFELLSRVRTPKKAEEQLTQRLI